MQFHNSLILLLWMLATAVFATDVTTPVRVGIATVPTSPYSIILQKMGTGDGKIEYTVDTGTKDYNPLIILTAIPTHTSKFIRWEGNVHSSECYSSSTVIRVTLNAIKTCTAIFDLIPELFNLSGKIIDEQQHGVANVLISTQTGLTATTDAEGNYSLTQLPRGEYVLTATKSSFNFIPNPLAVTLTATATVPPIQATEIFTDNLPRFTSLVATKAIIGEKYQYAITTRDPNPNETVTISALEKPTWLALTTTNMGTAILSGYPPNTPDNYFINLQVENTQGKKTTQSYVLLTQFRDNAPPIFTSTPPTQLIENTHYQYQITATDPENSAVMLSVVTKPTWLNFQNTGSGQANLSGTPETGNVGTHRVTVQAQATTGEYALQTFDITVINANYTLTISKIGNGTVSSVPSGIQCGYTCQSDFPNSSIQLVATPDSGFTFDSFSTDCGGGTVHLDRDVNCTVTFSQVIVPPPISETTCLSLQNITDNCDAANKTLGDVEIQSSGSVSHAIFTSKINNQGWVGNSTLLRTATLQGGIVTGDITNLGRMNDFEFRGDELYGGSLGGRVMVTRGILRNISLIANSYVQGGRLSGEIIGDAAAPALLENTTIAAGSHLVDVILGKNVVLETNVTVETSPQLPHLTDNSDIAWAISIDNRGVRGRPATQFSGGIATNNNYYKINAVQPNQTFQVRASIDVTEDDVGKFADILLVLGFEPPDHQGMFDGGVDTIYTTIDAYNSQLPIDLYAPATTWMTQFSEPFRTQILLQPRLFFNLWTGTLQRVGQYYLFLGYRLPNGTIVYTPSPLIIQVNM